MKEEKQQSEITHKAFRTLIGEISNVLKKYQILNYCLIPRSSKHVILIMLVLSIHKIIVILDLELELVF